MKVSIGCQTSWRTLSASYKLEVDQIDKDMLPDSESNMQNIEKHKSELEARISQVTKDLNVVISTEKTLAEKVK